MALETSLNRRLPVSERPLSAAFLIFFPLRLHASLKEDHLNYCIEQVHHWFGVRRLPAKESYITTDLEDFRKEMKSYRHWMALELQKYKFSCTDDFAAHFFDRISEGTLFPNVWKLMHVALILPMNTADCKRGFSRQNLIKSSFRTSLGGAFLDQLMWVQPQGPDRDGFIKNDSEAVARKFLSACESRRQRFLF